MSLREIARILHRTSRNTSNSPRSLPFPSFPQPEEDAPAVLIRRSPPRNQTVLPPQQAAAPADAALRSRPILLLLSLPLDLPPTTPPTPPPTTQPKTSTSPALPSNLRTLSQPPFETSNLPPRTQDREPTLLPPLDHFPPTNSPISTPLTPRDTSTRPSSTVRTEEDRTVTFLREPFNRRDPRLNRGGPRRQPTLLLSNSHR